MKKSWSDWVSLMTEMNGKVINKKIWEKPKPSILIELVSLTTRSRHSQLEAMQPLIASTGNAQVLDHPRQCCPMAPLRQNPCSLIPPQISMGVPPSLGPGGLGKLGKLSPKMKSTLQILYLSPSSPHEWTGVRRTRVPPIFPEVSISANAWREMRHRQAVGRRCLDYLCSTDQDRWWQIGIFPLWKSRYTFHHCSSLRQYPHAKGLGINIDLMDSPDVSIYKQQHLPGKYLAMLYDNFTKSPDPFSQVRLVQITTGIRLRLSAAPTLHWQSDSDDLYTIWKKI